MGLMPAIHDAALIHDWGARAAGGDIHDGGDEFQVGRREARVEWFRFSIINLALDFSVHHRHLELDPSAPAHVNRPLEKNASDTYLSNRCRPVRLRYYRHLVTEKGKYSNTQKGKFWAIRIFPLGTIESLKFSTNQHPLPPVQRPKTASPRRLAAEVEAPNLSERPAAHFSNAHVQGQDAGHITYPTRQHRHHHGLAPNSPTSIVVVRQDKDRPGYLRSASSNSLQPRPTVARTSRTPSRDKSTFRQSMVSMAVIDQVLAEVTHVVVRAAGIDQSTVTTSAPAETSTGAATDGTGKKDDNGSSSPLLFFVALGFGVVFTNLWIIVGVKYCFRYNARNRALRMNEEGDPVLLDNMPRPHRRRREKKLMTMDEVNDKFPMMKYKAWVSNRAKEGLPTAGGVSTPPSRANSVRDVDGIVPDFSVKDRDSIDGRPSTGAERSAKTGGESTNTMDLEKPKDLSTLPTEAGQTSSDETTTQTTRPNELKRIASEDTEDEDDHIDAALPPDCLGDPGDTCAICIDTLEDDDDVRGLTCGHAFHAVCVDPWLTSRRACCPLCKADYYTPKPRAPAEAGEGIGPNTPNFSSRNNRVNLPAGLRGVWFGNREPTPAPGQVPSAGYRRSRSARQPNVEPSRNLPYAQESALTETTSGAPRISRLRAVFRNVRGRGAQPMETTGATPDTAAVTPSQLEAQARPAATTTP
ncbi:hypothetical protein G7046_g1157 [Stylonectria norvegica]|nr:hypothetical protein G7046_g1157 [Stylonectria norvegica]